MAPQKNVHTIDRTDEYNEFIEKLRAFHEARGTHFDAEPKVGTTHVDLLKTFNHIVENGGYDKVTDEKLAWRKMAAGLGLFSNNEASTAFQLKQMFYKYLAAYEIKTIHNQEPPPPEILEHTSAKGGSLLTRTIENFGHNINRANNSPQASGDDATPSRERRPEETPSSGRASRGLREAPPQRVIFQPDTGSTRQTRHGSGQHAIPGSATPNTHTPSQSSSLSHLPPQAHGHGQAMHNPQQHVARGASLHWNPPNENFSSTVQNWEPRGTVPIPLRPVDTPGNNPVEFARRHRIQRLQAAGYNGQMLARQPPPPGFEGPNIYVRCLAALRSNILAEEGFALNHLVKISYERGDKYKFDSFPGLAEGLVEKALQVSELFYKNLRWTIVYDEEWADGRGYEELDGVNGTWDILERLEYFQDQARDIQDNVVPAAFADQMLLITEAILTIRNMVQLPENAAFMADFPPLKDLLCIILHLPSSETTVEIKHFALDIAEQLTPSLILDADDPLYRTLIAQLDSTDRGIILTSLRAIGRISMNLTEANKLGNVPPNNLQNITTWLLLNDDDLMDACLDFLYQYTAVVPNVETLLKAIKAEDLVAHLVRLLSHGAKKVHKEQILVPERRLPASDDVLPLPQDLQERLLSLEEPERCYTWLKCLFEEEPDAAITQIAIWSAYQQAFMARLQQMGRSMISPAEFIRNVNMVWTHAGAQIIRDGEVQKFIIKGIRARTRPVDPEGVEYWRCLWSLPNRPYSQKCNLYFNDTEKAFNHILEVHLGQKRGEDKRYPNTETEYQCRWAGCKKYATPTKMHLMQLMQHVKTHLEAVNGKINPRSEAKGEGQTNALLDSINGGSGKPKKRAHIVPARTISIVYEETQTTRDERNPNAPPQAAGTPLSAVLVLRNIARNVVKTESEEQLLKEHEMGGEGGGWNERLFRPLLPRLYEIMVENKALSGYITSLIQLIDD